MMQLVRARVGFIMQRKWRVSLIVCVGVFMSSLDLFIVNIAFPAISTPTDGAIAQSALASTKTPRPSRKARLRPNASAQRPAGTSSAAKTIA